MRMDLVGDGGARVDRRRLGGTYMTGLKLLADRVEGRLLSRATAGHAASIGVSGALSLLVPIHRERRRMARGVHCGERQAPRGAARRLRGAAWRPISAHDREQRSCSISDPSFAIARQWPMRSFTGSTRSR